MKHFGILLMLLCIVVATNTTSRFRRLLPNSVPAYPTEFPYNAVLYLNDQHLCGGALISRTHVLTAGHCVFEHVLKSKNDPLNFNLISVRVGSTVLGQGDKYEVQRIAYRKDFALPNTTMVQNDIAVVTLKTPAKLNRFVGIINLPNENTVVPTDAAVTVVSIGTETFGGELINFLKKTDLYIVSDDDCRVHYWEIPSYFICANRGPGYGTCGGDSGSPMIYDNKIVGIVSGGDGSCTGLGNPDYFTEVSHFLSFIRRSMQGRAHRYADIVELDVNDLRPMPRLPRPMNAYPQVKWHPWPSQSKGLPAPPVLRMPQIPQH